MKTFGMTTLLILTASVQGLAATVSLDQQTKRTVVETVGTLLIDKYIDLESAKRTRDFLITRLEAGDYDSIVDPGAFSQSLTADLLEASKDYHFFIEFNPKRAGLIKAARSQSKEEVEKAQIKFRQEERWRNFGFHKLEHLQGNIGYLDLRSFSNPAYGGETAVAAMGFLANMAAVIVDLRNNHGGSPAMVQLICSYFVEGTVQGRTHLNSFERRHNNSLEQYWTLEYVPGKRMFDTDLYVLVSPQTGSGAEEFAYNMKNLKRATLVGETTRGAAHPIDEVIIEEDFVMHLPTGRPINPISGTNWEGTGVEPDVTVPADQAFDRAYQMALQKLSEESAVHQFEINWALEGLKARLDPVALRKETLEKYAGDYGERKITLEEGGLYYRRKGPSYRMLPINETLFGLAGLEEFRIQFVIDKNGKVTGLVGLLSDGFRDPSPRE